jgi:DNA phosphorothioation-associated putative methyltransferase
MSFETAESKLAANPKKAVARHKAAIHRAEMSLPVKCLLRDGLLPACQSFFDYGCGHAGDIRHVATLGIKSDGWDPVHRTSVERLNSDAVNLGYVLNVIEDAEERAETLRDAWSLCDRVLSVAARILVGGRGKNDVEYRDGLLTRIGTFQKYFTQSELREYIESTLSVEAFPAAPGVFYVFRNEELQQRFLSSRYRRQRAAPQRRSSELRFEKCQQILEPLMQWITDAGRVPEPDECPNAAAVLDEFGSIKRAFALIRRVTGSDEWDTIQQQRSEDLQVYLALAHFRRRPSFSKLPTAIQRDVRAFFGTYNKGCKLADSLLFRIGDSSSIDEACRDSPVGKLLPNALYVHESAIQELSPLLRIYEGCARSYLGSIDGANIIKLHRRSGKVSYLVYPEFEINPHPVLLRCVKLSMRKRVINCYDYSSSENPPILHRKECFVTPDHPLYRKFSRLTQQEEKRGLFENNSTIGTRSGWEEALSKTGVTLRGHQLVNRKQ